MLSPAAERMQELIAWIVLEKKHIIELHKEALRKDVEETMTRMLHNPWVSLEDIIEWHKKVKKAKKI